MLNLGDIQGVDGTSCPTVDVIIGGSPCQDLSIAGSRAGLSGERSGLFAEQLRIVAEMRAVTNGRFPRYMVWENVPGALNSNHGKDFLEVLNGCVRISKANLVPVPMPKDGKWPKSGILYDDMGRWSLAWRVHDAQFWGVPQRRRRIALITDFRGMSAPEILFEPKGVQGDSDTRDTQRKRVTKATFGSSEESDRIWDARGNGNGQLCATITGDHESRITDYTNIVLSLNADAHESGISVIYDRSHTVKTTTREAICIGNGQAHVTSHYTAGLAQTLNCMHDPMTILEPVESKHRVRRLTPLECERLQGYPDGWTDIPGASDAKRYKSLGNSIALPFWQHLLNRIIPHCENRSMASLFDGIGGFPLCWLRAGGKTLWISEIDKFCCEVTRHRFG